MKKTLIAIALMTCLAAHAAPPITILGLSTNDAVRTNFWSQGGNTTITIAGLNQNHGPLDLWDPMMIPTSITNDLRIVLSNMISQAGNTMSNLFATAAQLQAQGTSSTNTFATQAALVSAGTTMSNVFATLTQLQNQGTTITNTFATQVMLTLAGTSMSNVFATIAQLNSATNGLDASALNRGTVPVGQLPSSAALTNNGVIQAITDGTHMTSNTVLAVTGTGGTTATLSGNTLTINSSAGGGGGGTGTTNDVYYNVLDYGADPTGATDSWSAFQAAINAAVNTNASTQPTIYLPYTSNRWIISDTLTIPAINVGATSLTNWTGFRILQQGPNRRVVGTALGTGAYPTNNCIYFTATNKPLFASLTGNYAFGFNNVTIVMDNVEIVKPRDFHGTLLNWTNVQSAQLYNLSIHPPLFSDNGILPNMDEVDIDMPNKDCGSDNVLNGVDVAHAGVAIRFSEHTRGTRIFAFSCGNGIQAKSASTGLTAHLGSVEVSGNTTNVILSGAIDLIIDDLTIERVNASDWRAQTNGGQAVDYYGFSGGHGKITYDVLDNTDATKAHRLKGVSNVANDFTHFHNLWDASEIVFASGTIAPYDSFASRAPYISRYYGTGGELWGDYAGYARGNDYSPAACANGDFVSVKLGGGYDGVATWVTSGYYGLKVVGTVSTTNVPVQWVAATGKNKNSIAPHLWVQPTGDSSVDGLFTATNGVSSLTSNRLALVSISPTGSPFNYTNKTLQNITVFVGGGTVSEIDINGSNIGMTSGAIPLQTNEWTTVTYTGAPTMSYKPF